MLVPQPSTQRQLAQKQVEAFYVDVFAEQQAADFRKLVPSIPPGKAVVDVGGGCGYFAGAVAVTGVPIRVIDRDLKSIEVCRTRLAGRVEAELGDALNPQPRGDEGVVCFNLILHHLVGQDERATRSMQAQAISSWRGLADYVFVSEYVYDSFLGDASGRLIYAITKSRVLSTICAAVARVVPSLKANTFGVGVRFRSRASWHKLFAECGFEVVGESRTHDAVAAPLRLLMIKEIRRDSFVLRPAR